MHYVYVLISSIDKNLYVGCTKNLKGRVIEHNKGYVSSTNNRRPLEPIYYEAFVNQQDAYDREKWLKTGWGKNRMNKILKNTFESLGS